MKICQYLDYGIYDTCISLHPGRAGLHAFGTVTPVHVYPALTGLVCSSPLPASGRRSWDRRGREEVRTGRHTMTDGRRASQKLRPTILLAAADIVLLYARPQDSCQWRREQTIQAFSCSSSSSLDLPLSVIHAHVFECRPTSVC